MHPLLLILFPLLVFSQSKDEQAYRLGLEGIAKVDAGQFEEGIKLLKQARNLQPYDYDYALEIGKAYLLSKNPKKAEKYLFDLQYHEQVTEDLYLLLADCYRAIGEQKPTPDESCRKELDALRYGIEKLPTAGKLYSALGKRNIDLGKTTEALATFEHGIVNATNYAENYFWASKLLKAAGNHLWAWNYAEVCFSMTDDVEVMRSCAFIIQDCIGKLTLDHAGTGAQQSAECTMTENTVTAQLAYRRCLLGSQSNHLNAAAPVITHMRNLEINGGLEAFVASLFETTHKELFLSWLADNASTYDRYRAWRYWNPMKLDTPLKRLSTNN